MEKGDGLLVNVVKVGIWFRVGRYTTYAIKGINSDRVHLRRRRAG